MRAHFVSFETGTARKCSPHRKELGCDYSSHRKELLLLIVTVDINYEVTSGFYSIRCISRRPGSLRVDAFRGHGFSLLEKPTLWGLQTRAIPAGVTTLHLPGL